MWHHFSSLYGKQIKYLVFQKMKKKIAFGKPFFSILSFLELRLNILLIRMRFASKLLEANNLVSSQSIYVNGSLKQKNYLVRVNDIVYKKPKSLSGLTRFFTKKWRLFIWRKWRKRTKCNREGTKRVSLHWFLNKIVLSLNYLEINYKILTGIVIRRPLFGETIMSSSKKILSSTMLKKIYFLY